ncbi:MAG: glycosyltransferase family 2 protein [Anaerolineaceae bacterium]|nr:glycosyltransferase family 2 protein [Anaerolineaceae bacterium]
MSNPLLSIVIPAHNEENRLPGSLDNIFNFLKEQNYKAEVLVIENGSHDRTLEIARDYANRNSCLSVFHEEERGKGLAVRRGMFEARGEYRIFCDADLSMPIEKVNAFIPPSLPDMDIAIASREATGAIRYNEPIYRHLIGRVFNAMVKYIALPNLQDTQCGFKCFRAAVAEDVFRYQTLVGMSFDAEVLFIARRKGYRIVEIPIPWYFNPDSRVRLFNDSMKMAFDLLAIRRNARHGLYDAPIPQP